MKQHYLLFLLFSLFTVAMFGKEITPATAESIARQFCTTHMAATRSMQDNACTLVYAGNRLNTPQSVSSAAPFYVFNYGNSGYVVVSGDDRMEQVLGYSDGKAFSSVNIPANVQSWFDTYRVEYERLMQGDGEQDIYIPETTVTADADYPQSLSPLLGDINWDQGSPYNLKCPTIDSEYSATGCVATAMAMVMKYHGYPEKGTGYNSYTTRTKKLTVSFNFATTTFDWDNMLPQYVTGGYTTKQSTAVATLMSACGVSVNMDYTVSASGAYSKDIPTAFTTYFGYDSNVQSLSRDYYTYSEWVNLIKKELCEGRPVLYSGITSDSEGHQFVFDGYDANNFVHVNWGWSGLYNGYFRVTSLKPENVGIGGGSGNVDGYNYSQAMVVGLQKPTSTSSYITSLSVESIKLSSKSFDRTKKSLTVTLDTLKNNGTVFNGSALGVAMEKDGVVTVIAKKDFNVQLSSSSYYQYQSIKDVTVPADLAEGEYLLYPVAATAEAPDSWQRVRCPMGNNGIYRAVISGDKVTVSSYWENIDVSAEVTLPHNLYTGHSFDFNIKYTNNKQNSDVYSVAGIKVMNGATVVSTLELGKLYLEEGESGKELSMSVSSGTPSAGTYTFVPVVKWGGSWVEVGAGVEATVNTASNTSLSDSYLTFSNVALSQSSFAADEAVRVTGTITVPSSVVYDGTLIWAFFNTKYTNMGQFNMPVFIEGGSPYQFDFSMTPNLSKGTYLLALFGDSQLAINSSKFLTVRITAATGIEDISDAVTDKLIVYPQPAENVLNLRTPDGAQQADVYDLSGRNVLAAALNGGTENTLEVSQLAAGTYLLVVKCGDDILVEKFFKK